MQTNYRNLIDTAKYKLKDREEQIKKLELQKKTLTEDLYDYECIREVFKKAALALQNHLATHIGHIVTRTLNSIFFEKDIKFVVEFVERRNTTECDLYVIENEHRFDLLDGRGHGMADMASMALRVAYISLDSCDNVVILDEPFRNLDKERQPYASELIKELSRE